MSTTENSPYRDSSQSSTIFIALKMDSNAVPLQSSKDQILPLFTRKVEFKLLVAMVEAQSFHVY